MLPPTFPSIIQRILCQRLIPHQRARIMLFPVLIAYSEDRVLEYFCGGV